MDAKGVLYGLAGTVVYSLAPRPFGKLPWKETVLQRFVSGPSGGLLLPPGSGTLYGATTSGGPPNCAGRFAGCGTIFSLKPPERGKPGWTLTTLYTFKGQRDGISPVGPPVMARKGSLFGITEAGGAGQCKPTGYGCGTIFELSPPRSPGGKWTHSVIFRFAAVQSGREPGRLIVGMNGNSLIGTAQNGGGFDPQACQGSGSCGLIFGLTPPPSGTGYWNEGLLHVFDYDPPSTDGAYPLPNLWQDGSGNVFGATGGGGANGDGTLFELTPVANGPPWPETQLFSFNGSALYPESLIPGPSGTFFGIGVEAGPTSCYEVSCGAVFMLTP
jgi:uncharacterized repeat protein (TIGR03803 family)